MIACPIIQSIYSVTTRNLMYVIILDQVPDLSSGEFLTTTSISVTFVGRLEVYPPIVAIFQENINIC